MRAQCVLDMLRLAVSILTHPACDAAETHGQARVIRCLQEHLEENEMSSECRVEVEKDEIRSNQDYRCVSREMMMIIVTFAA